MLIRRVVNHELGDDAKPTVVRGVHERQEIPSRAVARIDVAVIGDVVAIVAEWRWIERLDPDSRDAERLDVVQLLRQPAEVTDAVVVAVEESANVQLVDDRIAVPRRVVDLLLCVDRGRGGAAGRGGRPLHA